MTTVLHETDMHIVHTTSGLADYKVSCKSLQVFLALSVYSLQ